MNDNQWPTEKNIFHVHVYSDPDSHGKSAFEARWVTQEGQQRGQMFHANIDQFTEDATERKKAVVVFRNGREMSRVTPI